MAEMSIYDPDMFIMRVDVIGLHYQRHTPVDHRILAMDTRYSATIAATVNGVLLVEGSVNGEIFKSFVEASLFPILQPFGNPNSIVVMEKCIHPPCISSHQTN
jgi:hypothetical protein